MLLVSVAIEIVIYEQWASLVDTRNVLTFIGIWDETALHPVSLELPL